MNAQGKLHRNQMKMLLFLEWLLEMHDKTYKKALQDIKCGVLNSEVEEENEDIDYEKTITLSQNYLREYSHYKENPNCLAIANLLNECIIRVDRKLEGKKIRPMLLAIGALRHCDFGKVRGFDEFKEVSLDSIIQRAIQGKYLNDFSVQRLGYLFRIHYWEA